MKKDGFLAYVIIVIVAIVIGILTSNVTSSKKSTIEELEAEIENLQERVSSFYISSGNVGSAYDSTIENLASVENDIATVYCYFENENDITFAEAYDAFMRIKSVYSSIIR